jgi:2-polyprenyl-3-methyl-5-hydroxy-6-metoxy-1,4-benzoquinol methylase
MTVACPVCGEAAPYVYTHPEARIHRCPHCTHAFSDLASIMGLERYSSDYYEETHRNWFVYPNIRLFHWIERQLPSTVRSLIDVGCGRGQFLDYLRHRRPNLRLVGVDLSSNADRDGIEFHTGDALELELGKFDAVVSLATIEHIADATAFVKRLHSLCKPGGSAVVMTLDDGSLLYRIARFVHLFGMSTAFNRLYSAHHLHHFTSKSLVQLLERNGLTVQKKLGHSVPLKAIDVPAETSFLRPFFLAVAATLLALGDLTGRSYLQTVVAIRPAER